jgi:hypothetical protein
MTIFKGGKKMSPVAAKKKKNLVPPFFLSTDMRCLFGQLAISGMPLHEKERFL